MSCDIGSSYSIFLTEEEEAILFEYLDARKLPRSSESIKNVLLEIISGTIKKNEIMNLILQNKETIAHNALSLFQSLAQKRRS